MGTLRTLGSNFVVLCVAGLVLCLAVVSKALSGLTFWMFGVAALEMGVWLIAVLVSRRRPRLGMVFLTVMFASFVVWDSLHAFAGRGCGCFGMYYTSPTLTLSFSTIALVACALHLFHVTGGWTLAVGRVGSNLSMVIVGVLLVSSVSRTLAGQDAGNNEWFHRAVAKLDSGHQHAIYSGSYRVLVISLDCPDCRAAIPVLGQGLERDQSRGAMLLIAGSSSVAASLLQVLPSAVDVASLPEIDAPCFPVEVLLTDGTVRSVHCITIPMNGE